MSTRPVAIPMQAAISRFWVTARTWRPRGVRWSRSQTAATVALAKSTMAIRLQGSTTPSKSSNPPESQKGLATSTFWAPKRSRTVWISSRLIPQVASRVSKGRP